MVVIALKKYESILLVIFCLMELILQACSGIPVITPKETAPFPKATQLTTGETYPSPQDCQRIESSGLPVGSELRNSHIIYRSGNDIDHLNQLWIFDINSGLRKRILETSGYYYYAVGFLQDGNHFVMAGSEKFWLSDLAGSPPKSMELTSPELFAIVSNNFPEYSRIARDFNDISSEESPDGTIKAIWNLGDPNLVITNNETGKAVNVIQYDGHGSIAGNWSPDGEHYAFSYSKEQSKVYIVDADGSDLSELVTIRSASIGRPYWSPDGKKIAYTVNKGFQFQPTYYQILNIDTDESKTYGINGQESLALRNGNDILWSPDNEWILFYAGAYGEDKQYNIDIKALEISTGEFYCITEDSLIEVMADWR